MPDMSRRISLVKDKEAEKEEAAWPSSRRQASRSASPLLAGAEEKMEAKAAEETEKEEK